MNFHNLGLTAIGASVFAFLAHWSATFQSIAALCGIAAYGIAAYKSLKKN